MLINQDFAQSEPKSPAKRRLGNHPLEPK